ncbi:energy transducer TonB [Geothrix sp. PMB-07]|uniref:energy transducer TonB n=1 Tax=Geothrix sp. PMB-07 TaxID=3068640 RepID=UPI002741B995|nr:energy transducer TonB [Geothrix sp. PMB-07]WLT30480.1 energy transducer TonB [Geothrix sp. PMB-07]
MGNVLTTSVLSAPLGDWPLPAATPGIGPSSLAQAPIQLAEPPILGTLPKGPRSRVMALSVAVYGALFSAAFVLAVAAPTAPAPLRAVTVALETFDAPAPPPPPVSSLAPATTNQSATSAPRAEDLQPMPQPAEPSPVLAVGSGQLPAQGPAGGVPGGQGGGVMGGTLGGQVGGSLEGSASAVVAPRFDAAYLQNPEPDYPALSKRFGEEGKVILRVLVNPEGQPEQVEVRQSSGHARLDQAALGTVKRWRFTPARRGTERLAAWVLVPLSFQLDA